MTRGEISFCVSRPSWELHTDDVDGALMMSFFMGKTYRA